MLFLKISKSICFKNKIVLKLNKDFLADLVYIYLVNYKKSYLLKRHNW